MENKKWCNHVFFINVKEFGNRNTHFIWAPNKIGFLLIKLWANSLTVLVELYCFLDRVRNLSKSLSVLTVYKFLFLKFNLVSFINFTCCKLNWLNYQWNYEIFSRVLFFIYNFCLYMSALFNHVCLETFVSV